MRSLGLLTFMLPVGYSSASGILSGNALGEGNSQKAMTYYKVCMMMASLITVFQMTVLLFARDAMIKMYTDIDAVEAMMIDAWPVLIIFTFFDTTQAMGMSVIRASGKQGFGAFITGTAYFVFGIPTSYYFAFVKEQGCRGLWWGPTLAVAYNTLWYNVIILRMDWPTLIAEIKERRAKEEEIRKQLEIEQLEQEANNDEFKREKEGSNANTIQ